MLTDISAEIGQFLAGVLCVRDRMHDIYSHYTKRRNRVHWGMNGTGPLWTEGYIQYGLGVTGSDGKHYIVTARLRWPGDRWITEAEAELEEEDAKGSTHYPLLRSLPAKESDNWRQALEDFSAAAAGLTSFDDLIPA